MPRRKRPGWAIAFMLVLCSGSGAFAQDPTKHIATLKAVSREGTGNEAAAMAWKKLVGQGLVALMPTLEAIDDANPTTANWLRTAVGAIAENEVRDGGKLPLAELEGFAKNTKFAPSARRIAYELLVKQDATAKERLLPVFLSDDNLDLRRDAVALELSKLEQSAKPSIKADLEKLLTFARDKDQVETIVKKLEEDYKATVNVAEHFGFITRWHLVGPFESKQGQALSLSFPPEKAKDASGKFKGKGDVEVAWKAGHTTDRYGVVNLNKLVGNEKDVAAYALAFIQADKSTPFEIRVATPNAVQIFLNGEKLFEREEYHHGAALDMNNGKGTLKAGTNVIVLKLCQNNQTEKWAQDWQFQARVCDATGGPLPNVMQAIPTDKGFETIRIGSITKPEEKK